jgi:hypothetical protein
MLTAVTPLVPRGDDFEIPVVCITPSLQQVAGGVSNDRGTLC